MSIEIDVTVVKKHVSLNFIEKYVGLKWKKRVNIIIIIIIEYAWISINKQGSEYASSPKHAKFLNMAKFWIWQGSQYVNATQRSEYAIICLDRIRNISRVVNMTGIWIRQGSEYAGVAQGSYYALIKLNMSE